MRLRIYISLGTLRPDASVHEERAWLKLQIRSVLSNLRCVERSDLPLETAGQVAARDDRREARELIDDLLAHLADDDRQLLQWQLDGEVVSTYYRTDTLSDNSPYNFNSKNYQYSENYHKVTFKECLQHVKFVFSITDQVLGL